MRVLLYLTLVFVGGDLFAQCTPSTPNPDCITALTLTVGGACVNGTTCGGAAETSSSCLYSGSECSWYEFTATATNMYVQIEVTSTSGCHISSNVYEATAPCVGTEISCLSGAPLDDVHSLTGLTVGTTYYVQICYSPGGPCGRNGSAEYCISVGEPDPPCDLCSTPCGTAQGFTSAPTVQQVVDGCQTSPFVPELQPSSTNTFCYDFTATDITVDFNVIITSNCGSGNVSNLTWELHDISCSGGPILTGDLTSLTLAPVVIGEQYVFCYSFTVPSTCTHSQHCPYFIGAIVLESDLSGFEAYTVDQYNQLEWSLNELDEKISHFYVQRLKGDHTFETIAEVNYIDEKIYHYQDRSPLSGYNYYRVKTINHDGSFKYSTIKAVNYLANNTVGDFNIHKIFPQPSSDQLTLIYETAQQDPLSLTLIDHLGVLRFNKEIQADHAGLKELTFDVSDMPSGVYTLILRSNRSKVARIEKIVIN